MPFVAGGYTVKWNSVLMGQIEDGINIDYSLGGEEIRGDNYGDTVQDIVFRGGDCFFTMTFLEWDTVATSLLLWPWSATAIGKIDDGYIGRLMSTFAKVLLLEKVTGPSQSPASITVGKAVLAPRFNVNQLLAPRLKRLPIRFQALPYNTIPGPPPTGNNVFFV